MRITAVRPRIVANTWKNWVLVELETDQGLTGLGEATLEHRTRTVATAIEELAPKIVGYPVESVNDLFGRMVRETYTPGILVHTVLSGYETALWDLLGQAVGRPLTELFGGTVRERIPSYANGWYRVERTPKAFADAAMGAASLGYRALKFDPFGAGSGELSGPERHHALSLVQAVREAVPPEVDLIVEGHGRLTYGSALWVAEALQPFHPLWYEEPLRADDTRNLGPLLRRSPVPIGVGERAVTLSDFRALLDLGPVGVLQPDVVHVGGLTAARKIAALAEAYGTPVAFHNAQGPISTAASLVLAAVTPNAWLQEYFADFDPDWTHTLVEPPITLDADGFLRPPGGPGLGVRLRMDIAEAHPYDPLSAQNLYAEGWQLRKGRHD